MRLTQRHPRPSRRGYTLTELLVVIGIIVLIVTLAVPAFNAISGNRSTESAQNQIQAIVGRARQEALGLQDYRGVLVFPDPNTGRFVAAEVYYPDPSGHPSLLELAPSHDELLLPFGLSVIGVQNQGTFNGLTLVMFNGQGLFCSQPYSIDLSQTKGDSSKPGSYLGARMQPLPGGELAPVTSGATAQSSFGFLIVPSDGWRTVLAGQGGAINGTTQGYLNDNGLGFMVNRYNGTLLRTE